VKNINLERVECITLNTFEAAALAGVGHNRIREWVDAGELPALPGRRILIVKNVLIAFLESQSRGVK
jgi:excisionase family DNA binding protein